MHALLAHAYHAAQFGLHVLLHPLWRAPGACLLVALGGRVAGVTRSARGAAITGCGAVLAGWLLLDPHWMAWPPPPVARLPGLALILLGEGLWRTGRRARLLVLPVTAALAAWWLRGAPLTGAAIVNCMPVFLGLLAGLPVARRLARGDAGWGSVAACLALAGSLLVTGAAVHWARAACVVAVAGLASLGVADAGGMIVGAVVVVAAAAMVASDRGRLIPVDAACLAPLLAWLLTPRLARRVARHEAAFAGLIAVALCVGLSWAAAHMLTG